jgi:hypothetical protein
MSITGLTGVFGMHRQIGPSNDLTNPNMTAKGPYNAGIGGNSSQTTVQTLTLTSATSGTFRLGFRGQYTTAIAYNATSSTVQTALEALSTVVTAGDITVTGNAPHVFNFAGGRYEGQPIGVTLYENNLNVGSTAALVNTTYGGRWYYLPATSVNFQPQQIVQSIPPEVGGDLWARGSYKGGVHGEGQVMMVPRGGLGLAELLLAFTGTNLVSTTVTTNFGQVVNEASTLTTTGTWSSGNFTLTYSGQTTASIPYNATAAQVRQALENLSNIEVGDVLVSGGPFPGTPMAVTWTGRLTGLDITPPTFNTAGITGGGSLTVGTTTSGLPFATKLVGTGSNGVQAGNFKYRFIPQSGTAAELPWYTLVRNVGGKMVEEFSDARLGNFAFDLANTNILNVDASFVSRAVGTIAVGSGPSSVGEQKAGNGLPFQSVDAVVMLDSNVSGTPGQVQFKESLLPTRLNIGFANQLSTNEHVVGSYFLQDITNQSRTANVTYSVYLKDPDLYMRTYSYGATPTADAAWSSRIWKGALKATLYGGFITGNSGDRYTLDINIPEMDYMATPIALAGNNLVEYQLTTNVVLSQNPSVFPFYIDYTTNENIN